jgi:hypothetical protein
VCCHISFPQCCALVMQSTNYNAPRIVEGLVPLFVACTIESQTIESIRASDSQNVLASPLFRQALIVTALKGGHESLVRELISHTQTTPPPPETCVFKMRLSSVVDDEGISAGVWAALVATGWALPSSKLVLWAASAGNGPDGVALLNAIVAAGFDMHANLMYKETLPSMALVTSEPEVLEYLFDLYSVTPTSDMLIQAIELREKGGVEVLRWLLDTHELDVNYVRQGRGLFDIPPEVGDPRDRDEREYAMLQAGTPQKPRTALHAAALRGNIEAYEFLLGRGASDNAGGGQ